MRRLSEREIERGRTAPCSFIVLSQAAVFGTCKCHVSQAGYIPFHTSVVDVSEQRPTVPLKRRYTRHHMQNFQENRNFCTLLTGFLRFDVTAVGVKRSVSGI
jgi:hypothetical protein